MSKHTPGPWVAVSRTNAFIEIEAPEQHGYSAKKVASTSLTNHEANARLIAAAPEIYEALEDMLGWQTLAPDDVVAAARAATAKARGEK